MRLSASMKVRPAQIFAPLYSCSAFFFNFTRLFGKVHTQREQFSNFASSARKDAT